MFAFPAVTAIDGSYKKQSFFWISSISNKGKYLSNLSFMLTVSNNSKACATPLHELAN
jgi:hypothetical protein